MKLTTKPNSTTEFDLEFSTGHKGLIVRRKRGHRDVWTLLVAVRGKTPTPQSPSPDILHFTDADNFETMFFRAMMVTGDEIEAWEEEHRVEFAEEGGAA